MKIILVIFTLIASVVSIANHPGEDLHNPGACGRVDGCADIDIELLDHGQGISTWPWPIAAIRKCIQQKKGSNYTADFTKQADGEVFIKNIPVKCCQLIQSIQTTFWSPGTFGLIYWNSACTTVVLLDVPQKSLPMIKAMFT